MSTQVAEAIQILYSKDQILNSNNEYKRTNLTGIKEKGKRKSKKRKAGPVKRLDQLRRG